MESHYSINVSKAGTHYCRIALGEHYEAHAVAKLRELRKTFGPDYRLTMTYWDCKGISKAEWNV